MNILDFMRFRQQPDPTQGTGHVFNPYGKNSAPQRQQQGGGWMNKPALGGSMSRGDLLLASMGMLSGRNFQEGMANAGQYMAYGMDRANERQKEQQQKAALAKAMQGMDLTPQQRALMGINPGGVTNALTERAFATPAGPMEINDQLVDPNTREVLGDYRTPEAPNTPDYVREEFSDGIYEWIPGQPDTFRKVGDAPMDSSGAGDGRVEYGVTPVYGFDKDGNRIILQTSKTGDLGVPELPEGVTLESPYDRSYGQTAGRERARKDAYQTAEGLKVQAAEEDFSRYSSQIDRAIELSTTGNTGIFGQFKPSPDLDAILDTIESGTAFKTLVDLKAQGGTLGALSDTELNLLKAKIANVRRSQSRDQLHANLEILKLSMANSLGRLKQAYETEYAAGRYDRPAPNGQAATGGAAPRGAVGPSGQPVPEGFE